MNKKADSRIVAKSWVITQIKKTNRNTIFPKPFKQIYINPMFLLKVKRKMMGPHFKMLAKSSSDIT